MRSNLLTYIILYTTGFFALYIGNGFAEGMLLALLITSSAVMLLTSVTYMLGYFIYNYRDEFDMETLTQACRVLDKPDYPRKKLSVVVATAFETAVLLSYGWTILGLLWGVSCISAMTSEYLIRQYKEERSWT